MALLYECGWFTWPNTTAAQTITLVNSSLTPIAIILSTKGPGAHGFTGTMRYSIGFGTRRSAATQSGCIGGINLGGVSTTDTARVRNTTLLDVLATATARDYSVALDSFGAGTVGVTASNGTNADGDLFFYQVWGGDNLTDAIVINHTMDSTGATEVITGVGFMPSVLFALDSSSSTAGTISAILNGSFGYASAPSAYHSTVWGANDGSASVGNMFWGRGMRNDACLERLTTVASADARWDLDSFDADGVTLGVVDAPTFTTSIATFLFIEGGYWEAGNHTKIIDTGPDVFTLENGALTPQGVIFLSSRTTSSGLMSAELSTCLGATDGLHQGAIGWTGNEVLPTVTQSYSADNRCISEVVGTTASSAAEFTEFDLGSIQIEWLANNGSARLISYLAFDESVVIAAPVITPAAASYSNQVTASITSSLGTLIYYTLDGSAPTDADTLYETPLVITSTTTVKAIAYAGLAFSTVATTIFTVVPISAVTIDPNGGTYPDPLPATLTISTPGDIYYTLDGSTPTNLSTLYVGSISITESLTLKAISYSGALFGVVTTAVFVIQDAVPSEICHADMTKKMLHQTFHFMQETDPALVPANNVALGHWWLDMSVNRIKYRVLVLDEDEVSSEDWDIL